MQRSDLNKLAADLRKFKGKITNNEIREMALLPAADLLNDQLRAAAPATFIRISLGVLSKPGKYPLSVAVGLNYASGSYAANLAYGFEYGTVDRYHKSGKFTGRLTPAPWFRPTVDANRNQIVTNVINAMSKLVEKKLNTI
jgi:hypothetical protein